jgi:hypothetical protein
MHVKVRERDGQLGTQVESTDAHVVLITTPERTMEITEQDGGALLVRASDILGRPVPVRNELQGYEPPLGDTGPLDRTEPMTGKDFLLSQTQEERTGAKEDLDPEESMLRVGIQGIVSNFMDARTQARIANHTGPHERVLVHNLFQYVRKFRPSALEVTEDMVEYAARAAFNRTAAERGCTWAGSLNPTTEKTREEFRANARAAIEAALMFAAHEADAPQPKDPDKRGFLGLGPIQERTQQDYALTNPPLGGMTNKETYYPATGPVTGITEQLHRDKFRASTEGRAARTAVKVILAAVDANKHLTAETIDDLAHLVLTYQAPDQEATKAAPADVPPLKFGEFWDTMAELINSGFHLVVFQAGTNVFAAVNARGDDGVTPLWLVTVSEVPLTGRAKPTSVPLYHLSNLSSFRILGTYKHTQEVPF